MNQRTRLLLIDTAPSVRSRRWFRTELQQAKNRWRYCPIVTPSQRSSGRTGSAGTIAPPLPFGKAKTSRAPGSPKALAVWADWPETRRVWERLTDIRFRPTGNPARRVPPAFVAPSPSHPPHVSVAHARAHPSRQPSISHEWERFSEGRTHTNHESITFLNEPSLMNWR